MSPDDVVNTPQEGFIELSVLAAPRSDSLEQMVAQLFDEYCEPVYTHVVLMLANPAEAEDITQEVFLRLHRQLAEGKKVREIKPWLFRVAQNLVVDRVRATKPADSLSEQIVFAEAEAIQMRTARSPEQTLLREEHCQQVREVFSKLPARQRQCMHLKVEGFRYREIADVLGIARSTVIENVRRAMTRLAEEFKAYA